MSTISNTVAIPADDPRRNLVVENPDNSNAQHLDVKCQEVVVHSIENWEAEFAKQKRSQETEWTITIMPD